MSLRGDHQCQVLVVGAGPTGLVLAAQLAVRGIRVRLIDKLDEPSPYSRALVVHARSLEVFDKLGIAESFLEAGNRTVGVNLHVDGKSVMRLNIGDLEVDDTPYPFVLFISQAETERILGQRLAEFEVEIERSSELTHFSLSGDGVAATVVRDGKEEVIECTYIVGADGAHSAVRHGLGLPFEGAPYASDFILGDVQVAGPGLNTEELNIFLGSRGLTAMFPMKGDVTRVLATGHSEAASEAQSCEDLALEDLQAEARQHSSLALELKEPTWLARFRLHHRGVPSYRKGRAFVAGDAAHIHSPAGGQGMNTGIQDAHNLGWKLAMVLKQQAPEGLLDSYHDERHPVGEKLLKFTDRMFNLAASENTLFTSIRNKVVPWLAPKVLESRPGLAFGFVSQLRIRYRRSAWVEQDVTDAPQAFVDGPRAGDRAPDQSLGEGRFHYHLRGDAWQLVGFCGTGDASIACQAWRSRLAAAAFGRKWIVVLTAGQSSGVDIEDSDGSLHGRYGLQGPGLYLLRPDGHIAFRSCGPRVDPLTRWLDKNF